MRLESAFRFALYGVFALLFASGAVWLLADQMKNNTEAWQQLASLLLSLHGGTAMVTLMLLGALGPMHVQRAWRAKTNRVTGIASIGTYGLLIATAFGLYYLGSDALRPWVSYVHIALSFAVPAVVVAHVFVGRASVAAKMRKAPLRRADTPTLVPVDLMAADNVPAATMMGKVSS